MKKLLIVFLIILLIGVGLNYSFNRTKSVSQIKPSPASVQEESVNTGSRYINYSKDAFDKSSDKKRVFFFHAVWCPTCKVANEEFMTSSGKIPQDFILFKTDYDSESELKKKYNITYQHTFVLVDDQGNEIKKWNGGGIEELIENTR